MKQIVKGLLQKINLVEMDLDLQRQILVSIPSDQKAEMEKTVAKIASLKQQVLDLRSQIQAADPGEFARIVKMERATDAFKALARKKEFVEVRTPDENGLGLLTLNDGTRIDCLVAAKDKDGNWTLLNPEGEILEYPGGLVTLA